MSVEKNESSFEIYKLFLEDLRIQLTLFSQVLQDIDNPDFLDKHYVLLNRITRSLIASSKIVQLNALQLLIFAFEQFLTFLKGKRKKLEIRDKELIKETYDLLKNINQISEKDLSNAIAKKGGLYQEMIEHFQAEEKGLSTEQQQKLSFPVPEKKMLDLFKTEIENQVKVLSEGLLFFQQSNRDLKLLEPLMRSAHSIKGAAKVFSFEPIVQLAHAIEDTFVAAKEGKIIIDDDCSELLFKALDAIITCVSGPVTEITWKLSLEQKNLDEIAEEIKGNIPLIGEKDENHLARKKQEKQPSLEFAQSKKELLHEQKDRVLRLTAQNINRLMGLAAESMVETRWLRPFCDSLMRLKITYSQIFSQVESLKNSLNTDLLDEANKAYFHSLNHGMHEYHNLLSDRIADLEMFITRHSNLTDRLYSEVIESRMRPFADGIDAFPRMVWEMARHLKKKVRFDIEGQTTLIDRDILEKLEVPLGHLLRNAVDHGIESPEERVAVGKSPEGTVFLKASHKAGMLSITVSDDGRGVDLDKIRKKILKDNLSSAEMISKFSQQEILNFLFLPGFSTSDQVTEISGRGVGLDIVQNMLQEVSGSIQIENKQGQGISFHLLLPLTLSVIRALITKINKGIFAFPLARIEQAVSIGKNEIEQVENHQYFTYLGSNVGLVPAVQILDLGNYVASANTLPVVILNNQNRYYGIIVDEFLGEKELVLQDVKTCLGKISCISSGAVLENGDPVLILDTEDLIGAVDRFLSTGKFYRIQYEEEKPVETKKHILVVDDSILVREVECRLLKNQGYQVDWAVNGVDAWNAVRLGNYDLVVTDVDMPRMNGIELTRNIKSDARLKALPVMIVSYKEREIDRILGLEAGANYYFAKSTFGDDALIRAVIDLIGEA